MGLKPKKQQLAIRDYDNCFVGGYYISWKFSLWEYLLTKQDHKMVCRVCLWVATVGRDQQEWNSPKTNVKTELGHRGRVDSNVSKRSSPLCHFLMRFSRRGCHWNQHWNKERSDFYRVGSRRKSSLSSVGLFFFTYMNGWFLRQM